MICNQITTKQTLHVVLVQSILNATHIYKLKICTEIPEYMTCNGGYIGRDFNNHIATARYYSYGPQYKRLGN